jgi:hypothetical protein
MPAERGCPPTAGEYASLASSPPLRRNSSTMLPRESISRGGSATLARRDYPMRGVRNSVRAQPSPEGPLSSPTPTPLFGSTCFSETGSHEQCKQSDTRTY